MMIIIILNWNHNRETYDNSENHVQNNWHVLYNMQTHRRKAAQRRVSYQKIDIDYMTDSVVVEYDSDLITKEEIKKRLENSGYHFSRVAAM